MARTESQPAPRLAHAIAFVGALAGVGCDSLGQQAMPELPTWARRPGGALSVTYRMQLTNKSAIIDEPYERGRPEIDPTSTRVFVPSQDGGLYSVDARTGEVQWRYATAGPVQSEPLYARDEDAVYFGSTDGALYKIRAADGSLLWRFATNAEVARKPVIEGESVYFTNANDTLLALEKQTGKLRFYQHRTPAFGIEIGGHAGVAVVGGRIFTTFSDGVAMAYSTKDGSEVWPTIDLTVDAQSSEGEPPQYLDADVTPVVATVAGASAVLVAHHEGGVYALDAESGRTLWRNEQARGVTNMTLWRQPAHEATVGGVEAKIPEKRVLIAGSSRTGLWGLNPDTGRELWRRSIPEGGITEAVPVSGAVLVGTTRYGLFLIEPTSGGVIDGVGPGNEIAMTPAAFGQRAYAMTNGGQLLSVVVHPPPAVDLSKR